MPVNPPPLLDSSFELVKLFKFSLSPTPPFNLSAAYSALLCMLTSGGDGLGVTHFLLASRLLGLNPRPLIFALLAIYFARAEPRMGISIMKCLQYVVLNNVMEYMSDDGGDSYNLLWSNFEIVGVDFWCDEAYMKLFELLNHTYDVYLKRWGDAPVHNIAVSLFANKDQIHFLDKIGYDHNP
ncbi:hypothetical protein VTO73DRAFT_7711 [Trametes versicolor]